MSTRGPADARRRTLRKEAQSPGASAVAGRTPSLHRQSDGTHGSADARRRTLRKEALNETGGGRSGFNLHNSFNSGNSRTHGQSVSSSACVRTLDDHTARAAPSSSARSARAACGSALAHSLPHYAAACCACGARVCPRRWHALA